MRVGLVIVDTNEFVNIEFNQLDVGICVSVLRKSNYKNTANTIILDIGELG